MQVGWPQEPIDREQFRRLPPLARHCMVAIALQREPALQSRMSTCRECGRPVIDGSNRKCWQCRKNPNPRPPALHTLIEPMFADGLPHTIQSVVEALPYVKRSTITKSIQHLGKMGRLELVERGSYRRPAILGAIA